MLAKCEVTYIEFLLLIIVSVYEELMREFVVSTRITEDLGFVKYSVYISAQVDGLFDKCKNVSAIALNLLLGHEREKQIRTFLK